MAKTDKPNILVIWGDDIGISNLSCYSHGLMSFEHFLWLRRRPQRPIAAEPAMACDTPRFPFSTMLNLHRPGRIGRLILERDARRDTRYVSSANSRLLRVVAVAMMIRSSTDGCLPRKDGTCTSSSEGLPSV